MEKCGAITQSGKQCKAWAIKDSDPPLCAVHAQRNVGAGAKPGNKNALKHGFYSSAMTAEERELLEESAQGMTLEDELALMRLSLRRLLKYARDEELPAEAYLQVMKLLFTGARAIVYCERNIGERGSIDWDAALDALAEEWGWEL
jgi:hypothetical protein